MATGGDVTESDEVTKWYDRFDKLFEELQEEIFFEMFGEGDGVRLMEDRRGSLTDQDLQANLVSTSQTSVERSLNSGSENKQESRSVEKEFNKEVLEEKGSAKMPKLDSSISLQDDQQRILETRALSSLGIKPETSIQTIENKAPEQQIDKNELGENGDSRNEKNAVNPETDWKEDEKLENSENKSADNSQLINQETIENASSSSIKCPYELLRDQNIREIEEVYRKVFPYAEVKKQEKGKKRKKTGEKNGQAKKRKVEKVVDFGGARRSARERKPVDYCAVDEDDPDWEPNAKKKNGRKRKANDHDHIKDRKPLPEGWKPWNPKWNHIHNPFEKNDEPSTSSADKGGGRSVRPKKEVLYNADGDLPAEDLFIFCETCGESKYFGCEFHPLIFNYVVKLDVGPSHAGKDAGRGVFNNDNQEIPECVMFGPYEGVFYNKAQYNALKKTRGESGYAWALRDPEKIKVIGYVDPGPEPDPLDNWMSIVNCAAKTRHQNLVARQFNGGMWYKSIAPIRPGEELQVYYGDSYAKDIKINVAERDNYELEEMWEEEGVSCQHCGGGFSNKEFLRKHVDSKGCTALRRERNEEEVLSGIKPHVCMECGMGFIDAKDLKSHKPFHSDAKPFTCSLCPKAFKKRGNLTVHVNSVHLGKKYPCPDCEKPFANATNMRRHYKTVCNREEEEFKCLQCGMKFRLKNNMIQHIKAVHNRELPHKCEICGIRFAVKSSLNTHIRGVHSDTRPFKCEDCGAAYKFATELDHHRISKHTAEWYHNCDVCDDRGIEKGFLVPSTLKKHMMVHHPKEYQEQLEREKPAVCPKCKKRFPSEEQVQIHLKKMHNEF